MAATSTALSFLVLATGLAFCAWRFLVAYKKSASGGGVHEKIAFLITAHFIASVIQNGLMGLGMLFFAHNEALLSVTVLVGSFLVVVPAIIGAYTAYYIFAPHDSPKILITACVILGITILVGGSITPPHPALISETNSIDLRMSLPVSVATFYLLLISIGSSGFIFTKLFNMTAEKRLRRLCATLAILSCLGIANVFVRLIILYRSFPDTRSTLFDVMLAAKR